MVTCILETVKYEKNETKNLVTHVFPSATYRHMTCDIHACKEELVFGPHLHTPPGICNIYQNYY
jgi:hypothetical protein